MWVLLPQTDDNRFPTKPVMNEDPAAPKRSQDSMSGEGMQIARKGAEPNPQGKGQVGFLLDWHYSSPLSVVAKSPPQLLADYFTSLLVLSAAFKFKPAYEKSYFLYWIDSQWSLSLISPDEWGTPEKRESFVGTCVLHADSTWSISPSDNLSRHGAVADAIGEFYDGFVDKLQTVNPLEEELPFYEAKLPYYQRLFAAALSRSLKASLTLGGQLSIESVSWLERLPRDASRVLAPPESDLP